MHRRPRKIRRTGRHTAPSQVENLVGAAGKAAPAVAIAGVLVAAPAANAATAGPAKATTVAVQVHHGRAHVVRSANRTYSVHYGDTLAGIAQRYYDNYQDWPRIYDANKSVIANPNDIYVGEVLQIPADAPGHVAAPAPASNPRVHTPKHARTDPPKATLTSAAIPSGTLSCASLKQLWEDGGGSPAQAETAASIAMAESGGQQYATGSVGERGYWQINPVHGSLATYDPLGNAKAAVIISGDGTNWSPWTTYTSGAYSGRC
jgi:LysM repeat protein